MKQLLLACLALAVSAPIASAGATAPKPMSEERLDAIATQAMDQFQIPGIAIAVVQPGSAPLVRGYGRTAFNGDMPVTADTLFGIGSISKAFTTAAIARLAEEGKLSWDDRVIDYIPEFRMADPWVTREFQIRDLVTHRSGLAPYAGDLVILTESKANKQHVYQALANLAPATSFRTEYAYDNLLYIVAGDLIERVSGKPWGTQIQQSFLQPLGMEGCVTSASEVPARAPVSNAHELANGEMRNVDFPLPPVVKAAGGIYCNARGMARWINFNLGIDGKDDILGADARAELFEPVTPLKVNPVLKEYGGSSFAAYGLGWFLQDSYGTLQAQHGGGLPGMVSYITLFPESKLGVMVMTNRTSSAARAIAMQIAEDVFATDAARDVIAVMSESERERLAQHEQVAGERLNKEPSVRPALALDDYTGRYSDSWYGDIVVANNNGELSIDMGSEDLTATLVHVDGDRFIARWHNRELNADAFVLFHTNADGKVTGASMEAVSPRTDPSFNFHDLELVRQPPS